MNKFSSKYGLPLLIIIVGGWLIKLIDIFVTNGIKNIVIVIVTAIFLFAFGMSLQPKRRYKTWVKKLIIAFIFSYLILFNLGYFHLSLIVKLFDLLAINQLADYLIYIFLGWLFFD